MCSNAVMNNFKLKFKRFKDDNHSDDEAERMQKEHMRLGDEDADFTLAELHGFKTFLNEDGEAAMDGVHLDPDLAQLGLTEEQQRLLQEKKARQAKEEEHRRVEVRARRAEQE
eukprot:SAG31_NODE_6363_length_2042_cov_20.687597_1_plen_112_part_10